MFEINYLLLGLFLPLFPMSIVFNLLWKTADILILKVILLVAWPLGGLYLLGQQWTNWDTPPDWLILWSVLTAALYAFRLLSLKDISTWIGFFATSIWSLLWLLPSGTPNVSSDIIHVVSLSLPLIILTLLANHLIRHFGAAYMGLYGGLAERLPRFSGIFVFSTLAVIAIPIFPAFFTLLKILVQLNLLYVLLISVVWLLWSWAGTRLLQGVIIGSAANHSDQHQDISLLSTWIYAVLLSSFCIAGIYYLGNIS